MRCAKCNCVETPNRVNPDQSAAERAGGSKLTLFDLANLFEYKWLIRYSIQCDWMSRFWS